MRNISLSSNKAYLIMDIDPQGNGDAKCDASNPRVPLTTRQPADHLWVLHLDTTLSGLIDRDPCFLFFFNKSGLTRPIYPYTRLYYRNP